MAGRLGPGAALLQTTIGGAFVSVIPLAIAMIVLQRFWQGGLTEGAVKE